MLYTRIIRGFFMPSMCGQHSKYPFGGNEADEEYFDVTLDSRLRGNDRRERELKGKLQ